MDRVKIIPDALRPVVPRRTFYVIDGHASIHRAYHAQMANLSCECPDCEKWGKGVDTMGKDCPTCNGTGREPTKATYVFTRALLKLCREKRPTYLVMAEDGPRERLERRKMAPSYKAKRKEGDWELTTQARRIKQIVRAMGVPVVSSPGWEADDVIATLVDAAQDITGLETIMVSRDKDLAQLIGPGCRMYDAIAEEMLDGRWVLSKFGVYNYQMTDYLAMVGDSADEIKGVPGLGEVGAREILTRHLSVKVLLKKLTDNPDFPLDRWEKVLLKGLEEFEGCRKLIALNRECDLVGLSGFEEMRFKGLNIKGAAPLFRRLGFKRWGDE